MPLHRRTALAAVVLAPWLVGDVASVHPSQPVGAAGLPLALVPGVAPVPLLAQPLPSLPIGTQAGDVIFRQGTEAVSHMVRALDQGVYSHVGLLVGQPGAWQVVHATPAERPGQPDAVVLDSLEFFLAPQRARAFAVDRVDAPSAQARQQAVAWALAQVGRPFALQGTDHAAGAAASTDDGIYCTTLVWQAWQTSGLDWQVAFIQVQMPLLGGRYLLPSALAQSPRLQRLVWADVR